MRRTKYLTRKIFETCGKRARIAFKLGKAWILAIVKSVLGILRHNKVVDGRKIPAIVAVCFQQRSICKTALLAAISTIPRRSNIVLLVANTIGDAVRDRHICICTIRF